MTVPTLTRHRDRSRRTERPEPDTLPAAVRDLLDKAAAWPEYRDYFLAEADRIRNQT
jgi:hypothetical protein